MNPLVPVTIKPNNRVTQMDNPIVMEIVIGPFLKALRISHATSQNANSGIEYIGKATPTSLIEYPSL